MLLGQEFTYNDVILAEENLESMRMLKGMGWRWNSIAIYFRCETGKDFTGEQVKKLYNFAEMVRKAESKANCKKWREGEKHESNRVQHG